MIVIIQNYNPNDVYPTKSGIHFAKYRNVNGIVELNNQLIITYNKDKTETYELENVIEIQVSLR